MTYISDPFAQKRAKMAVKAHETQQKKVQEQQSAERADRIQDVLDRHKINNLSSKTNALCEALEHLPQAVNEALASASVAYPVEPLSEYELEILCLKKARHDMCGIPKTIRSGVCRL